MELSVNTDFIKSTGGVEEPLKLISRAGFRYIHWCHHWCDDFLYSSHEIAAIKRLLKKYELQLFDLHASSGIEKQWASTDEAARLAGEGLLLNRIRMTHELGGRAVVIHTNTAPLSDITRTRTEQALKTLKSVEPVCRELGVKIGMENLFDNGGESSFYDLDCCFSTFPPDYIGFCWDSGHSNIVENGIDRIAPLVRERLLILHMNDNHGKRDEHLPIGDGTNCWERVAALIAGSPYDGVLTQEVSLPKGEDPLVFLRRVRKTGDEFSEKIKSHR